MIYSMYHDKGCKHYGHHANIALQFQAQIGWDYSCKKYHNCTDEIEPAFNSQFYWIVLHIVCYNISSIDCLPKFKAGNWILSVSFATILGGCRVTCLCYYGTSFSIFHLMIISL